jgi:hypothetical protein
MTSRHVTNITNFFGGIERGDFTFIWEPGGNWGGRKSVRYAARWG